MGAPERRVQVRELTRDEVVALLKIEEAYGAARGGDAESSILRGGFRARNETNRDQASQCNNPM